VKDTLEFLLIAAVGTVVLMVVFLMLVTTLLWTSEHLNSWTHNSWTRRRTKHTSLR
jgi:uncharacterized protein HemY